MEDHEIIRLYWQRKEETIQRTQEAYGSYCTAIAQNILNDPRDTEECVSDTWFKAWDAMPPQWPRILAAFLGTITRNLSFQRYRANRAEKRGGGEMELVLEELEACVSGSESAESMAEKRELLSAVQAYLATLSPDKRGIFLCRYWYVEPLEQIARRYGTTRGNVSVQLHRVRTALREYLLERGYEV